MGRRTEIETAIRRLAPAVPDHELSAIADHAMDSAGLRVASIENAAWLSIVAYIRHVMTDYDELLDSGYDVDSARFFVVDDINACLEDWNAARRLDPDADAFEDA